MAEVEVVVTPWPGPLAEALRAPPAGDGAVRVGWLGQAGFVLDLGPTRAVIDPYLSDSLAAKYAGTVFPHRRMQPVPIAPSELRGVALVLCTHRHSDHMDPGTLGPLAAANPGAAFVVPAAEHERAIALGIPAGQLRTIDAGGRLALGGAEVEALPSAHEQLTTDAAGRHQFLGYVVRLGALAFYHSGDCVPYPGLAERLRPLAVDVALLPINGRDPLRASRGVPGNFHLEEAATLCREARIPLLVGHHIGMFDFNTLDPDEAARALAALGGGLRGLLPRPGVALTFRRSSHP